ncbi:MAG: type II toxin-antitoxin system VapC family toxin [Roseiflexaceae bacterium]
MSIRFLLDTNIISEPLRPTPSQKILEHLQSHQDEIAIAAVVWHELWFGCARLPVSARRTAIECYLDEVVAVSIPILPYDRRAAAWHAAERARLAGVGRSPPFADGQIAAIAKANDLTLVTINLTDYAAFQALRLTDWQ